MWRDAVHRGVWDRGLTSGQVTISMQGGGKEGAEGSAAKGGG